MISSKQTEFYQEYVTTREQGGLGEDRIRKIVAYYDVGTRDLLDIGCGVGKLLSILRERSALQHAVGIDVAPGTEEILGKAGFEGLTLDAGSLFPFPDHSFDTVTCGEVIEHVFDVDMLLSEIHRVLRPGGMLILTTPNLAYIPNRILLVLGIQPLFTETSLIRNTGRRYRILGQGAHPQGHLRIFTLPALQELLSIHGFRRQDATGYRVLQTGLLSFVDRALAQRPTFAGGFVIRAYRED